VRHYGSLVHHPGNEALFRAIEMSAISTANGYPFHFHAEGVRGTGKTSIIRAARWVLPPIERVRGCIYNCDPERPHCPEHADLDREELERIGTERVPMPFLELSPSAKLGTVVGSIDLEAVSDPSRPRAALLPGTIPQCHRGILFVDEINRLADVAPELADVLLDVMGTRPGRIQIEETGIPRVELPVTISVWAASNPDEEPGPLEEIRKQLSDRFDLVVPVRRPTDPEHVERVLLTGLGAGAAEVACGSAIAGDAAAEVRGAELAVLGPRLVGVSVPRDIVSLVASLYTEFSLESLRAVEALAWAARLNALLEGRTAASREDVAQVVPLALSHRAGEQVVPRILSYLESRSAGESEAAEAGGTGASRQGEASRDGESDRCDRRIGAEESERSQGRATGVGLGVDSLKSLFRRACDAFGRARDSGGTARPGWGRGLDRARRGFETGAAGSGSTADAGPFEGLRSAGDRAGASPRHVVSPSRRARPLRQLLCSGGPAVRAPGETLGVEAD